MKKRRKTWGGKMSRCYFLPSPHSLCPCRMEEGWQRLWREGKTTFSFVLWKAPYYHLSRPSLSPFTTASPLPLCLPLVAPTIASNWSFHPLPLYPIPLFSLLLLLLLTSRRSLFCGVIAWLINYKGNCQSEKSSWHFRLQRERNLGGRVLFTLHSRSHTHRNTHTHTQTLHTHTQGGAEQQVCTFVAPYFKHVSSSWFLKIKNK